MSDLNTQQPVLSENKRNLLMMRLKQRRETRGDDSIPALPRSSREFPMSFAQRRLWFLEQLYPGTSQYHVPLAFRIHGPLDVKKMERGINILIDRHEVLRTTFSLRDGEPIQVVATSNSISTLPVSDLTGYSATERNQVALELLQQNASVPFSLIHGPLLRLLLVKLEQEEHILLFTFHHIITDMVSIEVFLQELIELYASEKTVADLQELPIQYADFSVWQQERLQGDLLDESLSYWKKRLEGVSPYIKLPYERKLTSNPQAAYVSFRLPEALVERIKLRTREEGATLFQFLFAVFNVLLYRYSGQEDLAIGTQIANRNRAELERIMGFFLNTLVLRTDLSAQPSFRDLLKQVNQGMMEALTHQETPFEKIVEDVNPERNLEQTPFFSVSFTLQADQRLERKMGDVILQQLKFGTNVAKFDLSLTMIESDKGLLGELAYRSDLFEPIVIEQMIGHFLKLIEGIVENPEQRINELPLLTDREQEQVTSWEQGLETVPQELLLHDWFSKQARKHADAVALLTPQGRTMTFSELEERSNRWAHRLRRAGVTTGMRVAIAAVRSPLMVVGMLATLKAGAAYVPLDPSYPKERLHYMLEDAGVHVLLAEGKWTLETSIPVIQLENENEVASESTEAPHVEVSAESTVYVIYTSGSTGRPKGVVISHRAICNHMEWMLGEFPLTASDVVMQRTSCSFDPSVWEIFAPLLEGAKLLLPEQVEIADTVVFSELAAKFGVTVLQMVPSLLQVLVDEERLASISSLRRLYSGGETLTVELQNRVLDLYEGKLELINMYGPTEACIETTYRTCQEVLDHLVQPGSPVPIGRPMWNAQVYLLDKRMERVPFGVTGEIYIGGRGLANGYMNQPEMTQAKFVPNPFGPGLLYKTGDLAKYLPSGEMLYAGRIDHQVKVRGYRIELGEIEASLLVHPAVHDVLVMVREDSADLQQLVAYLTFLPETDVPTWGELRSYLLGTLPIYMIPTAYVFLDEFPLQANGKKDRNALPMPDFRHRYMGTEYVAPRSEREAQLAAIWTEVLGVHRVGVYDNFFEIGGHSLLAMKIVSRVQKAWEVEMPLRVLFEELTVAGLVKWIEQMSGKTDLEPIVPCDRQRELPLSFAQQRLWFLEQFEQGQSAYHIPLLLSLRGPLDVAALTKSFVKIINRHDSLRTVFKLQEGQPVQIVNTSCQLEIPFYDLRKEPDRDMRAKQLIKKESECPFDLQTGPMMRAMLLQFKDDDHLLLLTIHHIAADGWSMDVLFKELHACYAAFVQGKEPQLEVLSVQYADFAVWQREWLNGKRLEQQINYWKEQLVDLPMLLNLPYDRPRPRQQSFRGGRETVHLSQEIKQGLQEICNQEGATLFMALLASFQTLLYRYTGQDDIVVGSPIAGRNRSEVEGLIGFFVNTLVLRNVFVSGQTFRELLQQTRNVTLGAYANQDVPFEKLVEELNPDRDLSFGSLYQTMLIYQHGDVAPLEPIGSLQLNRVELEWEKVKCDLGLALTNTNEGLTGSIVYSTDLFDKSTIERVVGHFKTLVESIVQNPDQRLEELALLTESETQLLLDEWSGKTIATPAEEFLHVRFEHNVLLHPDAVAVVYEDKKLTYRELDERANQVAHALEKREVGPDVLVGLFVERSLEMIVGMLGVLKAGGAYVPLDPDYPQERLDYMISDSGVTLIVTQDHLVDRLPAYEANLLRLDTDWQEISLESVSRPICKGSGDNLAYIIYTSGSTGEPKGVMVRHHQVLSLFDATHPQFQFDHHDIWSMYHSYAFDFSVWEVFGALTTGGRLVVVPYWVSRDPKEFYQLVVKERVTILNQTPSAFRLFQRADQMFTASTPDNVLSLRFVIFGGEALEFGMLRDWFSRHVDQSPQLVNMYGITETTVHVTARILTHEDAEEGQSNIGRPLPGWQVYLLDACQQPVPIGVPGEIYVGGSGLSKGYLNRPELSAERFISHSFGLQHVTRLYRTGDLARYLANGEIEYMGRIDQQVKIRGFRIELGEIEQALLQVEAVEKAIVTVITDPHGAQRIIAYLVVREALPFGSIRAALQARLPEYMIPSFFIYLDELPLTANGKVDRRALPEPDLARPQVDNVYQEPRTNEETILVRIWESVLGLAQVGVFDNFFEIGGHSLLAVQIAARIREEMGLDMPIKALFEAPCIARLAEMLSDIQITGTLEKPITRVGRDMGLPASYAQQRLWFLEQFHNGMAAYNIPMSLRIKERLQVEILERSLKDLSHRHESLRTTFEMQNGHLRQVITTDVSLQLQVIEQSDIARTADDEWLQVLLREEAGKGFDLSFGPLWRVLLIQGVKESILQITFHHIITDAWSNQVIWQELMTYYAGHRAGQPARLPELGVQYADFAVWQQEWMTGKRLEQQLDFWRSNLENAPPMLKLPTVHPRPAIRTQRGAHVYLEVESSLVSQLKQIAQKKGVTLYMVLLAAYKVLLYRYSGQEDIVVGSPITNRNHQVLECVVGFFVNTLAIRTTMSGEMSFLELLERVRQVTLDAYEHQDLPFELLVEKMNPQRDTRISPFFQTMFVLQHAPKLLPGMHVPEAESLEVDIGGSKLDLTLSLIDSGSTLRGAFSYDTDLFEADTVKRMAEHFQQLLQSIVEDQEQSISRLSILTTHEHKWLLEASAGARELTNVMKPLYEHFETIARETPYAIAVVFGGLSLTYHEVNERANQLAHYLRERGVRTETIVGLCMERSIDLIVSILAVLKAGGAYLAIDPIYPQERKAFLVEDAGIGIMLLQQHLSDEFNSYKGESVVVDADCANWQTYSTTNPRIPTRMDQLAYVIYTSGSTGRPKGVLVEHQAMINTVQEVVKLLGVESGSRVLQFSSISFDVSVGEIGIAFVSGAILYLGERDALMPGAALNNFLQINEINFALLTPGVVHTMLGAELPSLRGITVGGEALTSDLVRRWNGKCRIFNCYGPTETTILSTYYECVDAERMPTIGHPIANTSVYVLDHNRELVPVGQTGELFIGGIGVARGYLNHPELTKERFLPNSFSQEPSARLYRTGDMVRMLPTGELVFEGRLDQQIKIRGFRVELGEIEATLVAHPQLHEAVVNVWEKESDRHLVAYVVSQSGEQVSPNDLRQYLAEHLPHYMLPSYFIQLDNMPITANGKVNRRLLPLPNGERPIMEREYVAPKTALEKIIARMWGDLLGVGEIGVHDDFFELGGHSLLASQAVFQLQDVIETEVQVRLMFEAPTVSELAAQLVEMAESQEEFQKKAELLLMVMELSEDELELQLDELGVGQEEE